MASSVADARNGGPSKAEMVAQVERMVYRLYQDPSPEAKSVADQWLQGLQTSEHAWALAWPLLQHQEVAVQNFGALMLHNKISKSWAELPREQYEGLRVELFTAIARCSGRGPRLVLIQLCRCLVAFAFATIPDVWPNTVVSMVHSLRTAAQSVQDSDFTAAVLQLLTILPEEYERTSDCAVAAKRGTLRRELKNGLPTVLSLLEEVLASAQSDAVKLQAMKCFSSWVEFGLPLPEIQGSVRLLLQGLLNEELFSQACDTLADIVSNEESMKYPTALRNILRQVTALRELCKSKLDSSDKESAATLCRMLVEVGEGNMTVLVDEVGREESGKGRGEVGQMVQNGEGEGGGGEMGEEGEACQLALDVTQQMLEFLCVPGYYPVDELCSEITFHFWDDLLEGIAMAEPPIHTALLEFYRPTLTSVIEVFPEKAQYPPEEDWDNTWSEDDRDSFAKYREDLCDLGEALQKSMHFEYLQHLCSVLSHMLSSSTASSWQSVEAVLFLLQGVASNITQHSSPLLHSILSQFPHMPPHPTLIRTALNLLGCLSSWFRAHPDLLQAVLPIILDGLTNASQASSAALAFRDVCGECAEHLAPIVMQIIPACQAGLSNSSLSAQDSIRLVAAVGSVLSSMPVKGLLPALDTLVTSRVQSLQSLAVQEPSEANKPLVERELAILSAFCHHIYPTLQEGEQHPVILLFLQLWSSLQSLISRWCSDQDVVESICICWNRAMRTVQDQYAPLLEGTIELLIKCYAAVHYAKLLDSAAQLVQLFGKESTCSALISTLLQQLHSLSLPFFQSALVEYPDTLQSYLWLMCTALKVCPALLLSIDGISQNLFDIGLAGLERPEQPTVNSASSLFVSYLALVESAESIRSAVSEKGASLVQYVLQAIAGAAPRSYLTAFSDVLGALSTHCVSLLSQWLEDLLSQDGFPSHHVSVVEKHEFKTTVLRGQGNSRLLKEKVKEFSLMCRGFHGTLYALQTS